MSENHELTIYTDGGSRGNPGLAAYAYVIQRPGQPDIEERCYLGRTTNNIAEYTGLVKALAHAPPAGGDAHHGLQRQRADGQAAKRRIPRQERGPVAAVSAGRRAAQAVRLRGDPPCPPRVQQARRPPVQRGDGQPRDVRPAAGIGGRSAAAARRVGAARRAGGTDGRPAGAARSASSRKAPASGRGAMRRRRRRPRCGTSCGGCWWTRRPCAPRRGARRRATNDRLTAAARAGSCESSRGSRARRRSDHPPADPVAQRESGRRA